jgi:hypothetical protein
VVVETASGSVPKATYIHGKVGGFNQRAVAGPNQGVVRENGHEHADAKDIIRMEAAAVGRNGFVFGHATILEFG